MGEGVNSNNATAHVTHPIVTDDHHKNRNMDRFIEGGSCTCHRQHGDRIVANAAAGTCTVCRASAPGYGVQGGSPRTIAIEEAGLCPTAGGSAAVVVVACGQLPGKTS